MDGGNSKPTQINCISEKNALVDNSGQNKSSEFDYVCVTALNYDKEIGGNLPE